MFMRKDAGEPTTINPNEATIIPVSPGEWIIDPELEAKDGSGFVKTQPPTVTTSHSYKWTQSRVITLEKTAPSNPLLTQQIWAKN